MAPTMDIEILRELFSRTVQAGNILHADPEFVHQVQQAINKLPPFKIGKLGQLQEWQLDYEENDPWNARQFLYQLRSDKTGTRGAGYETRNEAYGRADCEPAAAG